MVSIGSLALSAKHCLQRHPPDWRTLAGCMDLNFSRRRGVYGDAVVGLRNIQAASILLQLDTHTAGRSERSERSGEGGSEGRKEKEVTGLSVKFCGSGGAFVCARRDGLGR